MQELRPNEFEKAQPLFQGFDYSLSIRAAMEGNIPGRVFVADASQPQTAFALTVEGYLLGGEHDNTVQYYERVFALRDENPDYYYHLVASAWALLWNREKALKYLHAAVSHGWANVE